MVILIDDFALTKKNYHLNFNVHVPGLNPNITFFIDYWGPDFDCNIPLTESQTEDLKQLLNNCFGYPPFDKNMVANQIHISKRYHF